MCRKGRWCVLFIVVVYVTSWVVTQTQVLVTTSKHAITAANSVCLFLFLSWKCFYVYSVHWRGSSTNFQQCTVLACKLCAYYWVYLVKPPFSTLCNCLILLVFDGKSSLHSNSQRTLVELGSFYKVETWIGIAIIWNWVVITRSAEGILRSQNKSEKKMLERKDELGKRSLNFQDFKQKAMCSNLLHWIKQQNLQVLPVTMSLVWKSSICVGCCSRHCIYS